MVGKILIIIVCIGLTNGCTSNQYGIEDFEKLEIGTLRSDVHQEFGEPDKEGSGFTISIYELNDSTYVNLYFDSEMGLTKIRHFIDQETYIDIK